MLRYILKIVGLWVLIVTGAALLYAPAHAGELYGVATVGSKHLGDTHGYKYNERNLGLGLEYYADHKVCGIAGGAYENSYSRTSVYVLGVCRMVLYRGDEITVNLAAGLGAATGYRMPDVPHVGAFTPAGNLSTSIESRSLGVGLNIIFIPKVVKDGNAVLGIQIKKSF